MAESQQIAAQADASPVSDLRPLAPEGFEEFFRSSFRGLVATVMHAGATLEEAEDAAAKTLMEMLPRWPVGKNPLAYARKAAIHNFIKDKTRGSRRAAQRLIDRGHVPPHEGAEDGQLTEFEDGQWVAGMLSYLPSAQREVMEYITQGHDRDEIAAELGITRAVVRRRLCDARTNLAKLLNLDGEFRKPGRAPARSPGEDA